MTFDGLISINVLKPILPNPSNDGCSLHPRAQSMIQNGYDGGSHNISLLRLPHEASGHEYITALGTAMSGRNLLPNLATSGRRSGKAL